MLQCNNLGVEEEGGESEGLFIGWINGVSPLLTVTETYFPEVNGHLNKEAYEWRMSVN